MNQDQGALDDEVCMELVLHSTGRWAVPEKGKQTRDNLGAEVTKWPSPGSGSVPFISFMCDEKDITEATPQTQSLIVCTLVFKVLGLSSWCNKQNCKVFQQDISSTWKSLSSETEPPVGLSTPSCASAQPPELQPYPTSWGSQLWCSFFSSHLTAQCFSKVGMPMPHLALTPNCALVGFLHQSCPETEGLIHCHTAADF